ncbi:MAG TPA: hypothetical protein VGI39_34330 [Polyangiaceae bacterium]|jgi:hypothetical protein
MNNTAAPAAKIARVSWTQESRGTAKRQSREVAVSKLEGFLSKLNDKDAYAIDVVYEA